MNETYLKYIGAGSYLPDVPAVDLTKEEAEYHGVGRLIDSGLYERVEQPKEWDELADLSKIVEKKQAEEFRTDTQYGSIKKRGKS